MRGLFLNPKHTFKQMDEKIISILHLKIIRIYHECEDRIEKYVLRIAVWHQEACRVLTNGDPEGQI